MKRIVLVVLLTVVMLATIVAGSSPVLAQEPPPIPHCEWEYNILYLTDDEWWEYWCWRDDVGWRFVFEVEI